MLTGQPLSTKQCSNWPNAAVTECSTVHPVPSDTMYMDLAPALTSVKRSPSLSGETSLPLPLSETNLAGESETVISATDRSTGRLSFRPERMARALDQRFSCGLDLIRCDGDSGEERESEEEVGEMGFRSVAGDGGMFDKDKVEVEIIFFFSFLLFPVL